MSTPQSQSLYALVAEARRNVDAVKRGIHDKYGDKVSDAYARDLIAFMDAVDALLRAREKDE